VAEEAGGRHEGDSRTPHSRASGFHKSPLINKKSTGFIESGGFLRLKVRGGKRFSSIVV
jgi:hypothetical protein